MRSLIQRVAWERISALALCAGAWAAIGWGVAHAQGPVQYRAADNINNIPVSQATPLPVQNGAQTAPSTSGQTTASGQTVNSQNLVYDSVNNIWRSMQGDTAGRATINLPTVSTTQVALTGSATASTFTSALTANGNRKNCTIYSANAFSVALGTSPVAATSIPVAAGGTFKCSDAATVIGDQVNVASTTTSNSYVVWSQ